MGTKDFNFLDYIIAKFRNQRVKKYINKDDVVLDFGCGYQGFLLKDIKNQIMEGIGLDYDVDNRLLENIKFVKYRYNKLLPFSNNYFNKVLMLAVIEHFEESILVNLLKEINRVLQRNGKIILTTPTPSGKVLLEFLANTLHIISSKEISDHKKYYSKKDIIVLANKSGYDLEYYQKFQFGINSICILTKKN